MTLLIGNIALADDWYINPASPTNVMMNPIYAWYPANIYHNTVLNPYKRDEDETNYSKSAKANRYKTCVKYGGGNACKSIK